MPGRLVSQQLTDGFYGCDGEARALPLASARVGAY